MILGFVILFWICFSFWHQKREKRKKKLENPYIDFHKHKLRNDEYYKVYLKWCEKVGELPMNKQVFIKEVEDKEKYIKDLFNRL